MFWGGIVNFNGGKAGFVRMVLETNFVKFNYGKGFGGIYILQKFALRNDFFKKI